MRHLLPLFLLLSGCMSLDFLVFSAPTVDEYVIDEEAIDPSLVEIVTFDSADGAELYGAWVRDTAAPRPPLIYFHGNGGHLGDTWARLAYYYEMWGYDVFAVDYRGFGMSTGPANYEGVFETDGLGTVEYVVSETGYEPEAIPWVAISMGAGVAAHTNDEIGAQSVILHAMFPSTNELGDDGTGNDLPMGWFFDGDFDNLEAVSAMTSPVFVIHGLADDYIDGPQYGPMVYDAAPDPKELWQPEGVAHSNLYEVLPEEFRDRSREFFSNHGSVPPLPE